ncbi:hypothetical protein EVAR_85206_1 [Eumeta japonica]|uniref:Uncharacterized protein n=1 Tax=Eumeta variegata TaxID=151549 RepID=A0A4C1W0G7_EUMVA|nr:hypothetical protein EVAR_85206_1 [Eumeta japonica]
MIQDRRNPQIKCTNCSSNSSRPFESTNTWLTLETELDDSRAERAVCSIDRRGLQREKNGWPLQGATRVAVSGSPSRSPAFVCAEKIIPSRLTSLPS